MRGFFGFAHIDGLDPAVYARLLTAHRDESRARGLDRLELVRFLQVSQTITVHPGALAFLLGSTPSVPRVPQRCGSRTVRRPCVGTGVPRVVGRGNKPATMPVTVPVLRVLEACRGDRAEGPPILRPRTGNPIDRRDVHFLYRIRRRRLN